MKKIIKILLLLNLFAAIILSMIGCQDAAVSPFDQPQPVQVVISKYPLAIGNYWKYFITYPDNNDVDTLKVSIISKEAMNYIDSSITCFNYIEKYSFEDSTFNSQMLGKIFNYKEQIFMTQNNRYVFDPPQFSRILIDSITVGKTWEDTLFQNLPGIKTIIEKRVTETKLDTTLYSIKYRNCYKIARYWIYINGNHADTIKTGTDIYCPSIGLVYQSFGSNGSIYEERILKDYMFSIKN